MIGCIFSSIILLRTENATWKKKGINIFSFVNKAHLLTKESVKAMQKL